MTFISYAQNFEDVMLHRALHGVKKGFYVDIGAQDPCNDSVTKAFYDMGWSGINVDPARHWFERLVQERAHDTNLCVAVSDRAGEMKFYDVKDTGLSTTNEAYARRHLDDGFEVSEYIVPCVTLDEICRQNKVGQIHFLKVDCEGAEAAALRGFSFDSVRPWIVLVEATEPKSKVPAYEDWQDLLLGHGYHFVYADGLNRFYVADERIDLDGAFIHPPNVFDQFRRASEHTLLLEQQAARTAIEQSIKWQEVSDFLRSENERREAALVDLRHRIGVLGERLETERRNHEAITLELRREGERRDQDLAEQLQQLRALREDMDLKELAITALRGQVKAREESLRATEKQIAEAHSIIAGHQVQMARERADSDRVRQELANIHQSTSWRVTRPLRATRLVGQELAISITKAFRSPLASVKRTAKPALRKIAQWEALRRPVVALLGKHSAPVNRARAFLFGPAGAYLQGGAACR
ncbi:FkbM family methyltransferase [Pseudoxanthomonas sp. F37]|uniref:FkbM family methyltransferase n=1 Tax=Pseudoxanthomonas sp. F37 TaxID=2932492 RepID=UPI001FD14AB3|nr:FkbM family methyltransferase [Pseudoxanthomonas sp. F37]UOV08193.1 FkbM family methyltransferase [Pseudoxanthomonas sp. F37]